ncbi:hypothetical protein IWX90DRAFT_129295 [Phyllosticta citrichinensis]|uniref:Uncharacterized protein n=1 Tax=Phyllosticta citrichinensis TaxID=1130410 RepID=A0ABR1Y4E2_9PEZI
MSSWLSSSTVRMCQELLVPLTCTMGDGHVYLGNGVEIDDDDIVVAQLQTRDTPQRPQQLVLKSLLCLQKQAAVISWGSKRTTKPRYIIHASAPGFFSNDTTAFSAARPITISKERGDWRQKCPFVYAFCNKSNLLMAALAQARASMDAHVCTPVARPQWLRHRIGFGNRMPAHTSAAHCVGPVSDVPLYLPVYIVGCGCAEVHKRRQNPSTAGGSMQRRPPLGSSGRSLSFRFSTALRPGHYRPPPSVYLLRIVSSSAQSLLRLCTLVLRAIFTLCLCPFLDRVASEP